jgi:hypothetical protein
VVAELMVAIVILKSSASDTSAKFDALSRRTPLSHELQTQLREMDDKFNIAQSHSDASDDQLTDKTQEVETARS